MSRISSTYRTLKQQNRKALAAFATAGTGSFSAPIRYSLDQVA